MTTLEQTETLGDATSPSTKQGIFVDAIPFAELVTERRKREEEFQSLLRKYRITIETVSGCGDRAQKYIDSAYQAIVEFVEANPEFKKSMPIRSQCQDDGTGGFASGISALSSSREECIVS